MRDEFNILPFQAFFIIHNSTVIIDVPLLPGVDLNALVKKQAAAPEVKA